MSNDASSHDSHDSHDAHGTHATDDAHGGGHGGDAPNFPFGEVIAEKNWQENVLMLFASVVLVGFVWLFFTWSSIPIPAVVAEGGDEVNGRESSHAVESEHKVQVIDVPKATSGTTESPEGHAATLSPTAVPSSPVSAPATSAEPVPAPASVPTAK